MNGKAEFEAWVTTVWRPDDGAELLKRDYPRMALAAYEYALSRSQDAPRCQCCGYLVTESEHRGCLRAAERSQDVARVPDGWKLVPVEPTDVMIEAGCDHEPVTRWNSNGEILRERYKAMLAAAPAEQPFGQWCKEEGKRLLAKCTPGKMVEDAPAPAEPKGEQQAKYDPRDPGNWRDGDDATGNAKQKDFVEFAQLQGWLWQNARDKRPGGVGLAGWALAVLKAEQRAATLAEHEVRQIAYRYAHPYDDRIVFYGNTLIDFARALLAEHNGGKHDASTN
jgi:hypothetical protein